MYYTGIGGRQYVGFEKIRNYYKSLNASYEKAYNEAKQKYDEDVRYNREIEQNQVMETKHITNDMIFCYLLIIISIFLIVRFFLNC